MDAGRGRIGEGDSDDGRTGKATLLAAKARRWVQATVMTLGFDSRTRRFVGTWIGSMMTHLWLYDGELDAGETSLIQYSDGPDMAVPDRLTKVQDVIEIVSDDHWRLSSQMLGDDGRWQAFMWMDYRRIL
jgi:hypothetical protein